MGTSPQNLAMLLAATTDDWFAFFFAMYFIAGVIFFMSAFLNAIVAIYYLKPPKAWWSKTFINNPENYTNDGKLHCRRARMHAIYIMIWLLGGFLMMGLLQLLNFRG